MTAAKKPFWQREWTFSQKFYVVLAAAGIGLITIPRMDWSGKKKLEEEVGSMAAWQRMTLDTIACHVRDAILHQMQSLHAGEIGHSGMPCSAVVHVVQTKMSITLIV